jgi:hypothetical protein
MLVRSSTGPPPDIVARSRAIHFAGSDWTSHAEFFRLGGVAFRACRLEANSGVAFVVEYLAVAAD